MPTKRKRPNPNPTGRPSLILDRDLVDRLLTLIKNGVAQEPAAVSLGIAPATLFNWKRRGQLALDQLDEDEPDLTQVPDTEAPFVEFLVAIEAARSEAEVAYTLVVRRAANNGDLRAALWWLDRAHPERWAQRQRVELTGAEDSEPVSIRIRYEPGDADS